MESFLLRRVEKIIQIPNSKALIMVTKDAPADTGMEQGGITGEVPPPPPVENYFLAESRASIPPIFNQARPFPVQVQGSQYNAFPVRAIPVITAEQKVSHSTDSLLLPSDEGDDDSSSDDSILQYFLPSRRPAPTCQQSEAPRVLSAPASPEPEDPPFSPKLEPEFFESASASVKSAPPSDQSAPGSPQSEPPFAPGSPQPEQLSDTPGIVTPQPTKPEEPPLQESEAPPPRPKGSTRAGVMFPTSIYSSHSSGEPSPQDKAPAAQSEAPPNRPSGSTSRPVAQRRALSPQPGPSHASASYCEKDVPPSNKKSKANESNEKKTPSPEPGPSHATISEEEDVPLGDKKKAPSPEPGPSHATASDRDEDAPPSNESATSGNRRGKRPKSSPRTPRNKTRSSEFRFRPFTFRRKASKKGPAEGQNLFAVEDITEVPDPSASGQSKYYPGRAPVNYGTQRLLFVLERLEVYLVYMKHLWEEFDERLQREDARMEKKRDKMEEVEELLLRGYKLLGDRAAELMEKVSHLV